jgi:bifunctional non-homologous end joining protein LigD
MSDEVQRLPTAYLLPIVARTENSALPFKGQLLDKIHHRRLRRTIKRLRCAAIVFNYGYMLQRNLPAGFIAPCLPTKTTTLPSGGRQWLHEIKHDGFRIIARKTGAQVRLYSRPGNDLTRGFPLIVETLARLRSRSCIVDGEAVACDDKGVASFDLVRHHRANDSVFLYAFDLIELNGDDLRRDPLEVRKATLASILAKARTGIRFNEHVEGDGPTVFAHACKLGLEGIASKRKDSAYRSGRSPDWLKMKNPDAPAVKREEGWGRPATR